MNIFHQRSHIHDGLKNLSDKEIILKVREAPTKLKQASQSFLKKLKNYGVKLHDNGEIDYSMVRDKNVVDALKKKESLVKVTMM